MTPITNIATVRMQKMHATIGAAMGVSIKVISTFFMFDCLSVRFDLLPAPYRKTSAPARDLHER